MTKDTSHCLHAYFLYIKIHPFVPCPSQPSNPSAYAQEHSSKVCIYSCIYQLMYLYLQLAISTEATTKGTRVDLTEAER